ncbi:TonB-dependent receptor [Novosphingobium sp.]|uniref:TonB-dependent receptor n=1 Tax=Novosphingobium sp. TaxID=1874826 RepID=UPI0038BE01D2
MAGVYRTTVFLVGPSVSALMAMPALAQDATPAAGADPLEIIVTAQKRAQNLLDVPLSIQAVSGAQLEERGTKELNDLVESIPGASSVSRSAPGFETIQIRGVASGTTGDATVGYYVDDVPYSVPNLQLAPPSRLFDLQRVEVLRGPQGTLYGQGAMGGTIRMVTASPDYDRLSGKAQIEGSTLAGGQAGGAVDAVANVPIVSGVAALRLSGGYERVGGFADVVQPVGGVNTVVKKNANPTDSWNIRGKLGIKASDRVTIELGAWHVDNHLAYRNTMDGVDPETYANTTGPLSRPNFIDTRLTLLSGVVNADLGATKLTSSTSYIDSYLGFDASYLNSPLFGSGFLRNQSTFKTKAFTQELRLASNAKGPLNWLVGGYFSDGKLDSDICLGLIAPCAVPFPPYNINTASTVKTRAFSLFGEASYALFGDRVTATVGGRYFEDKRTARGFDRYANAATTPQQATFHAFNPRFNLSWKLSRDFLAYANVAKGFRSGSFQTEGQAAAASAATGVMIPTAIQPDHVWSYEVGAKGKLFDGLVILDSAIYEIDWTAIQLNTTINGVATLSNGGNARIKGVDLGLTLRPVKGLELQAVGNINDAHFTAVLPGLVAINPLAGPGSRVPGVPKSSLQLSTRYGWTVGGAGLQAFVAGSYMFRNAQLDTTGLRADQLNEFSLRAGLSKDTWRVQVFGENLTNTRVALVRGTLGVQPNLPRRIGVRLGVDF